MLNFIVFSTNSLIFEHMCHWIGLNKIKNVFLGGNSPRVESLDKIFQKIRQIALCLEAFSLFCHIFINNHQSFTFRSTP